MEKLKKLDEVTKEYLSEFHRNGDSIGAFKLKYLRDEGLIRSTSEMTFGKEVFFHKYTSLGKDYRYQSKSS